MLSVSFFSGVAVVVFCGLYKGFTFQINLCVAGRLWYKTAARCGSVLSCGTKVHSFGQVMAGFLFETRTHIHRHMIQGALLCSNELMDWVELMGCVEA